MGYVCIYNLKEEMMVKKFEICQNKSFDGTGGEFLDRRKMTEFGSLSLVDDGPAETEMDGKKISLPGVARGDHSGRVHKPEIQVTCVQFSPTARSWAACTTEGLLVYSLDTALIFDPFDLDIEITPKSIRDALLVDQNYSIALMQALRLNERALISLCVEKTPSDQSTIDLVVGNLADS